MKINFYDTYCRFYQIYILIDSVDYYFALSFLIYFELEKDFKILFPLYMYGNH